MVLDRTASEYVILENIGKPLRLDLTASAWGIHEIINEDVARAFRIHASERGVDYRNCSMIAFGGSGPVHAMRVARKLKIPRAIFPLGAGVFSAFGLLVSPLSFDVLRSNRIALEELTPGLFSEEFQPLIDKATELLKQAGIQTKDIRVTRRLDMRYQGQGFEIEVLLPEMTDGPSVIAQLPSLFANSYEKVFSISLIDRPMEVINWKVEATGPLPEVIAEYVLNGTIASEEPLKGKRPAYFAERKTYIDCPVYNRYALKPHRVIEGPALIEERESTCLIGLGDIAKIDSGYNLVVDIEMEGEKI